MKKKYFLNLILIIFLSGHTYAQVISSFVVQGEIGKFYPVTFVDGGRINHVATEIKIGRNSVHENSSWRGSLIASFEFHVTGWGNGSNFIKAEIVPSTVGENRTFIAGWRDATTGSSCNCIIIWLRGGGTTYHYKSNYAVNPIVYDEVQNPLPYNESNGPAHTFKTILDDYVSPTGIYQNRDVYFMSKVGIGTTSPDEKLTVKGKIHTQEVRVDMTGPLAVPDYVFASDYILRLLPEVESYIKENSHLPEIPSANEIEKNGLLLAEMNMSLLKKVEELTLYAIEQDKKINAQSLEILSLKNLEERFSKIEKNIKSNKD